VGGSLRDLELRQESGAEEKGGRGEEERKVGRGGGDATRRDRKAGVPVYLYFFDITEFFSSDLFVFI